MAQTDHATQVLQFHAAWIGQAGLLDPRQPFALGCHGVHGPRQDFHQALTLQSAACLGHAREFLPNREQPFQGQGGLTFQRQQALRRMHGHVHLLALFWQQKLPRGLQLTAVMTVVQTSDGQAAHQTQRRCGRKRTVLGQQAGRVQGGQMVLPQAIRFQTQTQRQGAACCAMRQQAQVLLGGGVVAVVQGPAHSIQISGIAQFQFLRHTPHVLVGQHLLEVLFPRRVVAQRMGAFSRQQMQQAAHQTQTGQVFGRGDGQQTFNLAERLHGGFARTGIAPGHPQHHGIEQGGLRHPFALLGTPTPGLGWQLENGKETAQGHVQQDKAQHQTDDHQVQGQVDAVGRHKHRDGAVLLAQPQRHRHRHTKQRQ